MAKAESLLSILIPVYNEEKTLQKILDKTSVLKISKYEIIIVDDSSRDSSPEIIANFIKSFRSKTVSIKHYRHKVNKGKGAGIQTALKHATGKYFVIQDADLEYEPSDITKLLKKALQGNHNAVYGSRFLGSIKGMPKPNYVANRVYNVMLRIMYRTKITDMHTCYKMVKTPLIKRLGIKSNGFDYATELVSKLLKNGTEIYEVPIRFKGRTKKEGKKIDVMDGIECTYKLVRFRFTDSEKLFSEKSTTYWRFLIVGAVGFFTNYLILVGLFHVFDINHVIAELVAAVLALQVTFVLHDRWTYNLHVPKGTARLSLPARYISYVASNAFGSLMTVVAFGFLYNHMSRLPALLISALTGLVWNYLMNTYVIWRQK